MVEQAGRAEARLGVAANVKFDDALESGSVDAGGGPAPRSPYVRPTVELLGSVARVALVSGGGSTIIGA